LISQGNQFARDGLLRESVSSYKQALAAEPANMTAQRNLGIVLVKAGDYTSAVSYLEKSMSVYNDNFDANYYLAEAYRALDNYGEAIFRYKSALKIQKDDPKALKSLAWCYYKTRYFTEALNISQKLLVSNPRDDQVPIIVARVYLRLKRSGEALALVRKYGARVSGSSQPYYWSVEGDILNERGETAEASQVYQRALKSQPMLAGALLGMAKIHLAQGKTNLAVDHLERAVRIKPRMFEAHYYLGCALESTDPKRALRYFAFFRKNSASDPEHLDLIQDAKKRIVQLTSGGSKIDGIGN
jgi:tetratricopeptide (TPR) repeat protein